MLVVQKYGGTSVGSIERIKNVARKLAQFYQEGHQLVVVVSAMAGETDRLINLAYQMTNNPDPRELDVLLATGEQSSAALLAMALKDMGYPATSLVAFQARIFTDDAFGRARIDEIDCARLKKELETGNIVIVAGFQGIDRHGDITTLGRGGSDTTAVALAAALKADICEIYTDVEGVFTADPRICSDAKKINKISYDEMMELASLGAKVLQIRSVDVAKKYKVPVHVRSSFIEQEGTMVVDTDAEMEKVIVTAVTYNKDEARITVRGVPDRPGIAAQLFKPIGEAGIVVDMIIQNTSEEGITDMTFTVPKIDFKKALEIARQAANKIGAERVLGDEHIGKVSIVGVGMRNHPGVAARMFQSLANAGINILMISTSEIKVSCVIDEKEVERAVQVLHKAFDLGENA
ncbi:MAG: Aspartate kinase Ask_LysC [Candidatus Methanoperedenaceae archaeon GB50]|nr:Aspartate kinase Ask_LysC [Candidatus Methanoperedenaceae archaeon GB50]CAD7782418.1 Aspartate kinase Ask_LysC [Candidatus Methanoperedenaceae archaeon GB37]CAD7783164.1 MAG: Aspartate kinase Ask_LysC [Candidatus Methanoperedenaceae archaeon GB50]CAD7783168.1 MAG: Aspartate kinase Ask_LysC [Candidatus Methanoperedenaceae archaeon GB50]